jgi:hypothetical protein
MPSRTMKRILTAGRRHITPRGGMPPKTIKPNKCIGIKADGTPCGKPCVGPVCGTHLKAYTAEQGPKLEVAETPDSTAVLTIFDKLRTEEGMKVLNNGFVEMFVSREIFPPKQNVNKFVTGGIAEDVITDVITGVGFPTKNVAAEKTVIDIEVDVKTGEETRTVGISLKNSGAINQQPILENYRGESKADIRELPPSIIIYTETKIKRARLVYLDHAILLKAFPDLSPEEFNRTVYNKKAEGDTQSNLSFRSGLLRGLIPRLPLSYIVTATYPEQIPKVDVASITRLALDHVKKAIEASTTKTAPKAVEEEEETPAPPVAPEEAKEEAETKTTGSTAAANPP